MIGDNGHAANCPNWGKVMLRCEHCASIVRKHQKRIDRAEIIEGAKRVTAGALAIREGRTAPSPREFLEDAELLAAAIVEFFAAEAVS